MNEMIVFYFDRQIIARSFKRWQLVSTLRTLHFDLHPDHQAATVVLVTAWGLHQFEGRLELQLIWVMGWFGVQRAQTNRALSHLYSFLNVYFLL